MSAEEAHPDEAPILTRLLACDEALAAGTPLLQAGSVETPAELQPRLDGDLACIQFLRQVLPRRPAAAPAIPLTSEMPMLVSDTDKTPLQPAAGGTGVSPVDGSAVLPFQQLGRFRIQRVLGQGAFGMVFLAADPQLGRAVALKVPRPDALLTGELRERFVREARAAAGLDHPNLVPVYEAGAVGPLCYIASAYCPGITLAVWIKDRSELAPERLAAALVATLADAVGHAHGRGVIHRDLKPSNVLLQERPHDAADPNSTVQDPSAPAPSGAEGSFVPRITDFGLAKLTADAPVLNGEMDGAETRTGAVLGTPNYMAPEQASGKNKEVGPAADIYALGAILYELLTGRPPFRGESLLDTLEQVRSREPLPPGRLRPKLGRDLETICLKCLQKEPHKRYDSGTALAADLRRYLAGEPIQARPIRAWERAIKWARRKPAQAMLLVVAMALAAVWVRYSVALAQTNTELAKTNENVERANADLGKALNAKDEALTEEERQRRRAEANQLKARRYSYVSDMNLAQQDWASARVERLRELLRRQIPEGDAEDLRGFEWHYWARLANHSALRTLKGHTGEVWCLACSPDGKLLASGGQDHEVRFWDAATGGVLGVPLHFLQPVTAVAFAEGGRTLAVASLRSVFLFDAVSHKRRKTFPDRKWPITALASAGERMALGLGDGSVEIWELGKQAPLHRLSDHKRRVRAVAFSGDGSVLASGDDDGVLLLWDTATGKRLASNTGHQKGIKGVAFSPDGKHLATASDDSTVRIWDGTTLKESAILTGHTREVKSVQFSPDGKSLLSAGADATVRLWNRDRSALFVFKGHIGAARGAVFTPDGRTIVSVGEDGLLDLWDADRNPDFFSWQAHKSSVLQLAFTRDGSVLATGGVNGLVKLWEPATGRLLATLPPYRQPIHGLAFAADGRHLAIACLDPFVHIYDRQTAKEVEKLPGDKQRVAAAAFSPDGKLLAAGGNDRSVYVWDWQTRKKMAVFTDHKGRIRALAFSPDGKLLASSSADHSIKVWELATGRLRNTLDRHNRIVSGLSFSPDGQTLASGGEDGKIRLWDVDSSSERMVLGGHAAPVYSLAFSADGRTLASSSGEVKLWQTATGQELAAFADRGIQSVAWAPRGFLLAGGGRNGVLTIWNAGVAAP